MTPLVEEALKLLTSRCNTSALHPNDEDYAKITLRALKSYGEHIDPAAINAWLLSNNWQPEPIKRIVKWSTAVSNGGRVQIKYKTSAPTEKQILTILADRTADTA